ncbi:hypothetical protein WMY93_001496 [Mugilogobius chulae]|uniref:Uncharacterized protein n=1 Tax=Mugilogobius chulae TaxID=88201 RepID=A0AAW0QAK7_9GOBI
MLPVHQQSQQQGDRARTRLSGHNNDRDRAANSDSCSSQNTHWLFVSRGNACGTVSPLEVQTLIPNQGQLGVVGLQLCREPPACRPPSHSLQLTAGRAPKTPCCHSHKEERARISLLYARPNLDTKHTIASH